MENLQSGQQQSRLEADIIIVSVSNSDASSDEEQVQQGKKRKRVTKISCELCKARKVKCDKGEPACNWCTKNSRICIYKERRKPAWQASYGIEIEDKLNRMQTTIADLNQRLKDHIASGQCIDKPASLQPSHSPAIPDFWKNGISPNDTRSSSSSKPREPLSRRSTTDPYHTPNEVEPSATVPQSINAARTAWTPGSKISDREHNELPPFDMLYELVDMYFKHINTWSPILDRNATLKLFFENEQPLHTDELTLLHAIIAVTLRFCDDTKLTVQQKKHYHAISCQRVQLRAMNNPNMAVLRALALVTIDALGTMNDSKSWNLLTLLASNIHQLGLDIESSVCLSSESTRTQVGELHPFSLSPPNSWIENEGRRRLFWLTYVLDRYAAISVASEFILVESEIDRQLPCRYDLFSKNRAVETRWIRASGTMDMTSDFPQNLGSFSYHCEVLRILSQVHKFLKTTIDIYSDVHVARWQEKHRQLDAQLNSWLANLPGEYGKISELGHSDPGARVSNWIMIHAAFVTAVIGLHFVAAYPTTRSAVFVPSWHAVNQCLAAVESLCGIAKDVLDTSMLDLLGPPFAFSLWVSARLLIVHAAAMECVIDSKIWFLISTLEQMGHYWGIARYWSEILTRVVRQGQQAEEGNHRHGAESTNKTFSEMRRITHDLLVLTTQRVRTVLDRPVVRATTDKEEDYLEIFTWFDFPRLPTTLLNHSRGPHSHSGGSVDEESPVPAPQSGWLHAQQRSEYRPPYE